MEDARFTIRHVVRGNEARYVVVGNDEEAMQVLAALPVAKREFLIHNSAELAMKELMRRLHEGPRQ